MRFGGQRRCALGSSLGIVVLLAGCAAKPETLVTLTPATWFEDGWSFYEVSRDGLWATFGARFGTHLVDLRTGRMGSTVYPSPEALRAAGGPAGAIAWNGQPPTGLRVPRDAFASLSADRKRVLSFEPGGHTLTAGDVAAPKRYDLDGIVTGASWVPNGDIVYALVLHQDGLTTLDRVNVETDAVRPMKDGLDAPPRFNTVAVAPDGRTLYLALASDTIPDPADRHRPGADRDTDIYALDLGTLRLTPAVGTAGDDFHPMVQSGALYWTHNDFADDVVVLPATGGTARVVMGDGQIPYWSPDGGEIAFTYGGWRIADWALNLDAAVVRVDDSAAVAGPLTAIVTGYHEDFTPSWSPDGRWLAYHSHRSPTAVSSYAAPGSSDDIYIRRAGTPMAEEVRLTDFGWEVGTADWAPDGRRLVLVSWERGGPAGVGTAWIVSLDPATGRAAGRRRVASPPGAQNVLLAAWSPVRDELAVVTAGDAGRQALWIVALSGGPPRRLAEYAATTYGGVDWRPDGEGLVYGAMVDERMQLFAMSRAGGDPIQLTHDGANLILPQVSPDGRWIAATRTRRAKSLRRVPL